MNEADAKLWQGHFQHAFLPAWKKVVFRTFLPWALLLIYYFSSYPFDVLKAVLVVLWPVLLIAPFFAISYILNKRKYQKYLEEGNAS